MNEAHQASKTFRKDAIYSVLLPAGIPEGIYDAAMEGGPKQVVRSMWYGPAVDMFNDPDLEKKLEEQPVAMMTNIALAGAQLLAPFGLAKGVRARIMKDVKVSPEYAKKIDQYAAEHAPTEKQLPTDQTNQSAPKLPVGADVEDYEGAKPNAKEAANEFGQVLHDDYGIDAEIMSGKRSVENNRTVGGEEAERSTAETPVEGKNEGTIINTPQPDTEGLEYAKPSESKNVDESVPDKEVIKASDTPRWNHSEKDTMQFNQEESVLDKPPVKITSITGADIPLSNDFKQARKDAQKWAKENIRGSYTNDDTGWDISVGGQGIKHTASTATDFDHLRAIPAIPDLIKNAVKVESRPNLPDKAHIKAVHTFYSPLNIGEKLFVSKIVVKETTDGHMLYDHQASKIEEPNVVPSATWENKSPGNAPPSGSTMNIRDLLQYVKEEHKPLSMRVKCPLESEMPEETPSVREQKEAGAKQESADAAAKASLREAKVTYKNNPMDNPKAAKDILVNPDAIYGYSPKPDVVVGGSVVP